MESESEADTQITKAVRIVEGSTGAGTEHIDVSVEDSRNNCNFGNEKDLSNYESFDEENDGKKLTVEKYKEKWNMPEDSGNQHHLHAETTCEIDIDSDDYLKFKNHCAANDRDENADGAVKYEKNVEILQLTDNELLEVDEISALEDRVQERVIEKAVQNATLETDNVGEVGFVISVPQLERSFILRNNEDFDVKCMEGDAKQSYENTDASPEIVTVPESLNLSDVRNDTDLESLSTEDIRENGAAITNQMPAPRSNEDLEAENAEDARFLDNNTDAIVKFVISTIDIDACTSDQSLGAEFCGAERKDPDIASEETPESSSLEPDIHLAQEQGEDTPGVLGSDQLQDQLQGVLQETYSAVKNLPSANEVCKGQSSKAYEEQELKFSWQEIPVVELTTEAGWMPEVIEEHLIEQQDFSCDGQSVVHSAVEVVQHLGSTMKEEDRITFPGQEISEVGLTDEVIEDHPIENQEVSLDEQPINEQPANVEIPEAGLTDEAFEDHPIEKQKFSLGEQSNCEQTSNVSIVEDQQPFFSQPSPRETVGMESIENEAHSEEEEQVEAVEPPSAVKEIVTSVTEVQVGKRVVKDLEKLPECISSNKHMVDDDDQTRAATERERSSPIEKAECMQRGTANDENISLKTDGPKIHAPENELQPSEENSRVQPIEGNQDSQANEDKVCLKALGFQQEPSISNESEIASTRETQNPTVSLKHRRHGVQGPQKEVPNYDDNEQPSSTTNKEEDKSRRNKQGEECCSFLRGLFDENFARRADKSRKNVHCEGCSSFLCCTPKEEGEGCWCCSFLRWLFGYRC